MVHRFYKHTLLFDEGFPPRWYFPRLNERFDVKHIKQDFRKIGLPDTEVYAFARELNRLMGKTQQYTHSIIKSEVLPATGLLRIALSASSRTSRSKGEC